MAKQNVTFIERHAEKFAVGVAGAVLLGTIVFYGISSPNQVEVGGEPVGPKEFYPRLRERAESALRTMRGKTLAPPDELPKREKTDQGDGRIPMDYMAGVVPPHPPVPMTDDRGLFGELALAEILPPKALTVLAGRAQVPLPTQRIVEVGQTSSAAPDTMSIPADYHWALLVAAVDRKAQAAEFAKAKYDEIWQQLIVARVDVERRQLEPDGKWSAPVMVRGYSGQMLVGRTEIRPEMVENQLVFSNTEHDYVRQYRAQLYSPEMQEEILRPGFQAFLENPLAWQPPKTLPGFEFKLADFGVIFPVEGGGRFGPAVAAAPRGAGPMAPNMPGRPPAGGAQPAFDPGAKKRFQELMSQTEQALGKNDYLKAAELLQQILEDTLIAERDRKQAEELLNHHQANIARAQLRLEQQQKRDQMLGIVKLGEDQEPMWVTDITVEPGKTYQYRVRLVAFNELAGKLSTLKDPKDAEKVLVEGRWSDWSEPITIYPAVHVFLADEPNPQTNKVRFTISQWSKGGWRDGTSEIEVGQPLEFSRGPNTFKYDGTGRIGNGPAAIFASIEAGRQIRPRGRSGLEEPVTTDVLTLVNAAGAIEERAYQVDRARLREHREFVNQEKKLLASEPAQAVSGRGRSNMQLPFPGPRGMDDMGIPRRGGGRFGPGRGFDAPRGRGGPGMEVPP